MVGVGVILRCMPASQCPALHGDTQSDMLHSYRYIDNTVLWSYNTAGVLASLCYLFVLYAMYSIKFEQTLHPQNI